MAPLTSENSRVESAVDQVDRGSSVSAAEQTFFDTLDPLAQAGYGAAELLSRTAVTERIAGVDAAAPKNGVGAEYRADRDPDHVAQRAAATRAALLERLRTGIELIRDREAATATPHSAEDTLIGHDTAVFAERDALRADILDGHDPAALEGVISLHLDNLELADANERTTSFGVARALSVFRGWYGRVRTGFLGTGMQKGAELTSRLTGGRLGNGGVAKGLIVAGTVGGGYAVSQAVGAAPVLGGIGAGVATQQATYRAISNAELRKPDVPAWTLPFAAVGQYVRHLVAPDASRGEKRGWVVGPLQRALSFAYTTREAMTERMVSPDDMFTLGAEANGSGSPERRAEAMSQVERYAAVLQNRIDEMTAAGVRLGDDNSEYRTYIAALQVLSMSTVISRDDLSQNETQAMDRAAGLARGYQHVGQTRVKALAGSVAAGAAVGATAGMAFELLTQHRHMSEAHRQLEEAQRAEALKQQAEAAAAAKGGADAAKHALTPEITNYHEAVTHTAQRVFGTTEHTATTVDTGYGEHLVRLDLARTLGADASHSGVLTTADIAHLQHYGVVEHGGQLDFSHLTAAGRTAVDHHISALEHAATPVAGVSVDTRVAEAVTAMQQSHLDHEAMMMLSHDFKINIEQLRELRWTTHGSQSAHELFAEQHRVIDALVHNRKIIVNGKVIDPSTVTVPSGASQLDRVRAALKQWAALKREVLTPASLEVHRTATAAADHVTTATATNTGATAPAPAAPTNNPPAVPMETLPTSLLKETPVQSHPTAPNGLVDTLKDTSGQAYPTQEIPARPGVVVNHKVPLHHVDPRVTNTAADPMHGTVRETEVVTLRDQVIASDRQPALAVPAGAARHGVDSISDTAASQHGADGLIGAPVKPQLPPAGVSHVVPKIEGPAVGVPSPEELSRLKPLEEAN